MNAIPELEPISIAVVVRPQFQNACLGIPRRWIQDNTLALARYYKALTDALPPEERKQSDAEVDCWLLVQHDLEIQRQARARKAAESLASIGKQPPQEYKSRPEADREDEEFQRDQQARRVK